MRGACIASDRSTWEIAFLALWQDCLRACICVPAWRPVCSHPWMYTARLAWLKKQLMRGQASLCVSATRSSASASLSRQNRSIVANIRFSAALMYPNATLHIMWSEKIEQLWPCIRE